MKIGIGLPSAVAETSGEDLVEFAREAERQEFTTLGTLDRIVYDNYEPLIALAAAAAVTERIRLMTSILLGPLRTNTALLAKQALSVDAVSGGRLVLGLAVGAREDDYEVSGVPIDDRGARFDTQLRELRRIFSGEGEGLNAGIGPRRGHRPEIVLGGYVEAVFRRAAESGDGWIMGGQGPEAFAEATEQLQRAWVATARDDEPEKLAIAYYALGPNAEEDARRGLGGYYAWLGEYADRVVAGAAKDPQTIRDRISAFEQAGCDELIMFPSSGDPGQARLLREALSG
jgi:alkanesulfonate monooxygenase SsuD/methylene tetrahydromethanopterin reductase-like flavin-dependent oxidoreductase (luciferase family)